MRLIWVKLAGSTTDTSASSELSTKIGGRVRPGRAAPHQAKTNPRLRNNIVIPNEKAARAACYLHCEAV